MSDGEYESISSDELNFEDGQREALEVLIRKADDFEILWEEQETINSEAETRANEHSRLIAELAGRVDRIVDIFNEDLNRLESESAQLKFQIKLLENLLIVKEKSHEKDEPAQ